MTVDILSVFAIVCIAVTMGKITAKVKLPAILGWLITGGRFRPVPCRRCDFPHNERGLVQNYNQGV